MSYYVFIDKGARIRYKNILSGDLWSCVTNITGLNVLRKRLGVRMRKKNLVTNLTTFRKLS